MFKINCPKLPFPGVQSQSILLKSSPFSSPPPLQAYTAIASTERGINPTGEIVTVETEAASMCIVCLENAPQVLYQPCGHR